MHVALVGRRLPDNENLGLGYLEAALRAERIRTTRITLNRVADLDRVARRIIDASPALVGLAVPDGGSAYLPLALGELLRSRGYAGHVTAGGPFATLARQWLLERYTWLGSVVRFAGEIPVVGLARALSSGEPVSDVAGITTRVGDGRPAPVLQSASRWTAPCRHDRPRIIGRGVAHIMATRGCAGRCAYCGPASLQSLERNEGLRGGASHEDLRRAGIGGVTRRPVESLCDEIADLYGRNVRYFYFVDEHVLPYDETSALSFLDALGTGLRTRGVGSIGFGCMLRTDRLTDRILTAFAEVGLVRAFLGLELATADEGRRFARTVAPDDALSLVDVCRREGIAVCTNVMMVHPYTTRETIAQANALLARIRYGVCEATRMMVYHGTRLFETLSAEGRLTGNPLRWGYGLDDEVAARFALLFSDLRVRAFGDFSLCCRAHDVMTAACLARRLGTNLGLADRAERIERDVVSLSVEAHARALDVANNAGASRGDVVRWATERSALLSSEIAFVEARLSDLTHERQPLLSPMRAAAHSALRFALAGAATAAAACTDDAGSDPARAPADAGAEADADADATVLPPFGTRRCDDAAGPDDLAVQVQVVTQAPCFSGWIQTALNPNLCSSGPWTATPYFLKTNLSLCYSYEFEKRLGDSAAAGLVPLPENSVSRRVTVYGEMDTEGTAIHDAIEKACGYSFYNEDFVIEIDATGRVTTVRGPWDAGVSRYEADGGHTDVQSCLEKALAGLTFPCLAGAHVCPEYIIVE
jgi:anaerobic magnesium-protoporphyrin IX monomethyl ester cyclase